jgi:hypothetical protein
MRAKGLLKLVSKIPGQLAISRGRGRPASVVVSRRNWLSIVGSFG